MTSTLAPSHSSAFRFLLPSARDVIFLFLFWSLLAGPLSNRPLADPDIGWHIRNGERILATHTIPRTDAFSSTMQGQPWFAWEWLYDVLLGILYRVGGLNGVVWLCAVLVASTFVILLWLLLRNGTGLPLAVALMLLAEAASTIHLYARPHIVSWLFSLLWFAALERWEQGTAPSGLVASWFCWFFPVSMVLWVNLHTGWLFGLALLAIYTFASWIEGLRAKDPLAAIPQAHRARRMTVALILSGLATLLNPYGWQLHLHVYHYLTDRYLMNRIDEFRSPNFHGWAARCFAAMLVLLLLAFAGRRRGVRSSHLLVALLAVYAAFYSSRNLPVSSMLLALIAGPLLWETFVLLADEPGAWQWLRGTAARISSFSARMSAQEFQLRGHLWPAVVAGAAFAVCLQGGRVGSRQLVHAGFDSQKLPVGAAEALLHEPGSEPIFSTDSWGSYLIYRMYPLRKVVVDDRHDLYGSDRVRDFLILLQGEPGWDDILEKWKIRTAVLPAGSTLANLLQEIPNQWRAVYQDRVAIVFEKK